MTVAWRWRTWRAPVPSRASGEPRDTPGLPRRVARRRHGDGDQRAASKSARTLSAEGRRGKVRFFLQRVAGGLHVEREKSPAWAANAAVRPVRGRGALQAMVRQRPHPLSEHPLPSTSASKRRRRRALAKHRRQRTLRRRRWRADRGGGRTTPSASRPSPSASPRPRAGHRPRVAHGRRPRVGAGACRLRQLHPRQRRSVGLPVHAGV